MIRSQGFFSNSGPAPSPAVTNASFSQEQKDFVKSKVDAVPKEVREQFEKTYAGWKAFCNTPKIILSSNSYDRGSGADYEALVKMGKANPELVLPLLVQKLMDKQECFAHTIYEGITNQSVDSPVPIYIAATHATNWLKSQANK